jgi:hypothetical protein
MTNNGYKAIWLWNVFGTYLDLRIGDQAQVQDEDEV